LIGRKGLDDDLARYADRPKYQRLEIDFEKGEDPDDAYSDVPYEKGGNFLLRLGVSFLGRSCRLVYRTDNSGGWCREGVGRAGRVLAICETLRAEVHGAEYHDATVEGRFGGVFQRGRESEQDTRGDSMERTLFHRRVCPGGLTTDVCLRLTGMVFRRGTDAPRPGRVGHDARDALGRVPLDGRVRVGFRTGGRGEHGHEPDQWVPFSFR
jgi:hypothetical protein